METWQIERIAEFREHAALSNDSMAQGYLEVCGWNIFAALDNYYSDYQVA